MRKLYLSRGVKRFAMRTSAIETEKIDRIKCMTIEFYSFSKMVRPKAGSKKAPLKCPGGRCYDDDSTDSYCSDSDCSDCYDCSKPKKKRTTKKSTSKSKSSKSKGTKKKTTSRRKREYIADDFFYTRGSMLITYHGNDQPFLTYDV